MRQDLPERDAHHRAFSEVNGYLDSGNPSGIRMLSAPNGQKGHKTGEGGVNGQVRKHMDANPDLAQLSVNQGLSALRSAGVQAGRTTVAEVLQGLR